MPCVTASPETTQALQTQISADSSLTVDVDLNTMTVSCGDFSAPVQMGEGPRQMFLGGTWDACGQLVSQAENVKAIASQLPYTQWKTAQV